MLDDGRRALCMNKAEEEALSLSIYLSVSLSVCQSVSLCLSV